MLLKMIVPIPGVKILRGELMIFFPGGGFIQMKSADDPEKLVGEGLDRVIIDECADVAELAWVQSITPALVDKEGDAYLIGSPKGRNWYHRVFQEAMKMSDWAAFQMPTHTNPHVRRRELRRLEAITPKRTWEQEYLAKFVTFEGRVYDVFDPDGPWVFHDLDRSIYGEYFGGIDIGFRNPTAMAVAGEREDGKLDVVDEHYETRMTSGEIIDRCKELTKKYGVRQWWCDAAAPGTIQELQDAGLPVEACPRSSGGQESVVQWEVRLVAGLLEETRDGKPDPALRFHIGCENAIHEHDQYHYPKKRLLDAPENEKPVKKDDHQVNAVQYLCHGLSEWYGWDAGGAMASGSRETASLPK